MHLRLSATASGTFGPVSPRDAEFISPCFCHRGRKRSPNVPTGATRSHDHIARAGEVPYQHVILDYLRVCAGIGAGIAVDRFCMEGRMTESWNPVIGDEPEPERARGAVLAFPGRRKYRNSLRRYWIALVVLLCLSAFGASFVGSVGTSFQANPGSYAPSRLDASIVSVGEAYLEISSILRRLLRPEVEARGPAAPPAPVDLVTREVDSLMKEFGAEETSVPPEFIIQVQRFVQQYQDRDRDLMVRALVHKRKDLERVREILRRHLMPQDLAYMAVVESGFLPSTCSLEGAAGFWQFTENTAREYGMKVDETVDERLDLQKSTEAASRYIRDLILDFGAGSSVMLAMAAYNSGSETVHRAMRNVKDPIKQRNFWHLYQTRALPTETREYVPKVFAAIIVGRNPQQFGF
jgi:hypothetical protein